MSDLDICLFGRFRVTCKQQELVDFNPLKVQQLFCYLLLYPDRPHRREFLSDLLWGENEGGAAKKYLRKTLWQMQSAANTIPNPTHDELFLVNAEWIQINPHADIWIDVRHFQKEYSSFQGVQGQQITPGQYKNLQRALQLYQGDLLEGWDADWCMYERERYKKMFFALADKVMEYCESHEDFEAGIEYGDHLLRQDPASELAHWRMMRLYYLSGDRTAALRQYETCRAALKADLEVEPGEKTLLLYHQIVNSQHSLTAELLEGREKGMPASASLKDALKRIDNLIEIQSSIQCQLAEEISAIEQTLKKLL